MEGYIYYGPQLRIHDLEYYENQLLYTVMYGLPGLMSMGDEWADLSTILH